MARKETAAKAPKAAATKATKAPAAATTATAVRNTAIPKVQPAPAAASKVITHDMIAARAYEISCGPNCGSELDNWTRAERELKGR